MIISRVSEKEKSEFQFLMERTDSALNNLAKRNAQYFKDKGGTKLEGEVFRILNVCAVGTAFEKTIELVSGVSFPDIVAKRYFGVEVKSTEKNRWQSIGGSILESTRCEDIERIFMTFGKLGGEVAFKTKPYEECLSDIVVTHYPRYRIDMSIQEDGRKTIFEKMGVDYDDLRRMDNPVSAVSDYYRHKLKEGESLWWTGGKIEEKAVGMTVRLWSALDSESQDRMRVLGCVLFPEIVSSNSGNKYHRFALWLAAEQGIVHTNIRDTFSAGGRFKGKYPDGEKYDLPQVYGKIYALRSGIKYMLEHLSSSFLAEKWGTKEVNGTQIEKWIKIVGRYAYDSERVNILKFLNYCFLELEEKAPLISEVLD